MLKNDRKRRISQRKMSLYNLNKDMLVKLIGTIQENMKEKYEAKIKRLEKENEKLEFLRDNCTCCDIDDRCHHTNCEAFSIAHDYANDEDKYFKCKNIKKCHYCGKSFCDAHTEHDCSIELHVVEMGSYYRDLNNNFVIEQKKDGSLHTLGILNGENTWRPLKEDEIALASKLGLKYL